MIVSPNQTRIWQPSQISSEKLPELNSLYFNSFQIVDQHTESTKGSESYVDIAFGKYKTSFVGAHRFSVQRQRDGLSANKDGDEEVRVTMSCVTCNAIEDKRVGPTWSSKLHRAYAMMLFREGVAEVLR